MRLLRVEWARLFARRFTWVMAAVTAVVLAAILATTAQHAYWSDHLTLSFRAEAATFVLILGWMLALFGFFVGASFIGAEWACGGITNMLLRRPRRQALFFGKLVALLTGVLLIAVALGGALLAGFWLLSRLVGEAENLSRDFLLSLGLSGTRSIGFALAVTAVGAALASVGRGTATALGVLIGYGLLWEIGAWLAMNMMDVAVPGRYVLSNYVHAWLANGHRVPDFSPCLGDAAVRCEHDLYTIPLEQGGVVLGVFTALFLTIAAVTFRRRDIP